MTLPTNLKDKLDTPEDVVIVGQITTVNDWGYGLLTGKYLYQSATPTITFHTSEANANTNTNGTNATVTTSIPTAGQLRVYYTESSNKIGFIEANSVDNNKWIRYSGKFQGDIQTSTKIIAQNTQINANTINIADLLARVIILEQGGGSTVLFLENYNNSSLNTTDFGSLTANGGEVTETTALRITYDATNEQAALWYKTPIVIVENKAYETKFTPLSLGVGSGYVQVMGQYASGVVGDTNTNITAKMNVLAYLVDSGSANKWLRFAYFDTTNTIYYYSADNSAWVNAAQEADSTRRNAYESIAIGSDYYAQLQSNGTQFRYVAYDNNHSQLVATSWVNWSSVRDLSLNRYLYTGQPATDNGFAMSFDIKQFKIESI